MIWFALLTVNVVAAVPPKLTALAPVNPDPASTTLVPPDAGPEFGATLVTAGGPMKVKTSARLVALVPPTVVTVTSTAPAACAGEVAVIWFALFTVNVVAAVAPKLTALAPVKFVPAITTLVPPLEGPELGVTLVTVGAAT